jgi:hypothetical protein
VKGLGRRKSIINVQIQDPNLEILNNEKNKNFEEIEKAYKQKIENSIKIYKKSLSLNNQEINQSLLSKQELMKLQDAYDYLRENGILISFRAFTGRIERGSIPTIKINKLRYIPKDVLDAIIDEHRNFYSIKECYELHKKVKPINFRTFLGKIERKLIPCVKLIGGKKVPKTFFNAYLNFISSYYDVPEALEKLKENKVKITRAALERKLDRKTIPFVKFGGKRYIHKDVLYELINVMKSADEKDKVL